MSKKEEVKRKIIEAALIEFGTKGYQLASTNNIYKAAGVSKGTIFLYFSSKAELFYQVFRYYLSNLVEEMAKINYKEGIDIYEKIIDITFWKFKYFTSRPYESKVLIEAVSKPPPEVVHKIMSHFEELSVLSINSFFNDIDMNEFSNEYSKEEVMKFIQYALSGLQSTVMKENITIEYLDSIKDESLKFIKTVLKGMKK